MDNEGLPRIRKGQHIIKSIKKRLIIQTSLEQQNVTYPGTSKRTFTVPLSEDESGTDITSESSCRASLDSVLKTNVDGSDWSRLHCTVATVPLVIREGMEKWSERAEEQK